MLSWFSSVAQHVAVSLSPTTTSAPAVKPRASAADSFIDLWYSVQACYSTRRLNSRVLSQNDPLVALVDRLIMILQSEVATMQHFVDERRDALIQDHSVSEYLPSVSEDFVCQGPCLQALLDNRVIEKMCAWALNDDPSGMLALTLRSIDRVVRLQTHTLLPLLHVHINELLSRVPAVKPRTGEPQPLQPTSAQVASVLLCHSIWNALAENPSMSTCFTVPSCSPVHPINAETSDNVALGPVLAWVQAPRGSKHGDAARDAVLIAASVPDPGSTAFAIHAQLDRETRGGESLLEPVAALFRLALQAEDTQAAVSRLWGHCEGGEDVARGATTSEEDTTSSGKQLIDEAAAQACFVDALVRTAAPSMIRGTAVPPSPAPPSLAASIITKAAWLLCERTITPALLGGASDHEGGSAADSAATAASICTARLLRELGGCVPGALSTSQASPLYHLVTSCIFSAAPATHETRVALAQCDSGVHGKRAISEAAASDEGVPPCMRGGPLRAAMLWRIGVGPAPLAAATLDLCLQLLREGDRETLVAMLAPLAQAGPAAPAAACLPLLRQQDLMAALCAAAVRGVLRGAGGTSGGYEGWVSRAEAHNRATTTSMSAASAAPEGLEWVGLGAVRGLRGGVDGGSVQAREAAARVLASLVAEQRWNHSTGGSQTCPPGGSESPLIEALLVRATTLLDAPSALAMPLMQSLIALLRCPFPAVARYLLGSSPDLADRAGPLTTLLTSLWEEAHRRLAAAVETADAVESLLSGLREAQPASAAGWDSSKQLGTVPCNAAFTTRDGKIACAARGESASPGSESVPVTDAAPGHFHSAVAAAHAYLRLQEWTCEVLATMGVWEAI